ncbi:MAG: nucleotidyl transferase AbiEii/AbiGii toxin family protein [Chitinophagaceae bacterium]|nr:nucleotidyl transferase AbiEii/AbiGii toxin family protein [Chitinophagaceae bacterium]
MLQIKTVEPNTLALLRELQQLKELSDFSLVGGTALSLVYGHRLSIDLDLFSNKGFELESITNALTENYGARLAIESSKAKWGIFCYIDNIKVDLINYPHACIKDIQVIEDIRMYSLEDICAMKINAILGRGKKKDFWDIAELLGHFSLKQLMAFHKEKYPSQNLLISIPQAISYFDDAEESEDPISLKGQTWEQVKKDIQKAVSQFLS